MSQPTVTYASYVAHARQSTASREQVGADRLDRAWQHAHVVADYLRRRYAPSCIIAFGSLVHPELFDDRSDLDLAVEGIAWPDYLRAWNEVDALSREFEVDLIDIETVSDLMRRRIQEEGRPI
jgi:predicted nucleotidyltransferase